jgi:hypothetical protein
VTRPTSLSGGVCHRIAVAADALVQHFKADQLALNANLFFAAQLKRYLPRNGAFSSLQIQAKPASQGVVVSSIS